MQNLEGLAVAGLLGVKHFALAGRHLRAFYASALAILAVVFTGVIGLYPNLIPSSLYPASSLNAYNSSSSIYTLRIMTVVALIFVPVVIVYQLLVYRVFRWEIGGGEVVYGQEDAYRAEGPERRAA